jgi:hypothetical protein
MGMTYRRGAVWWIKYYRNGRPVRESSGSTKESDAIQLLKIREGDIAHGLPVDPQLNRIRFDEAADDLETEYAVNRRRSADELERRIRLHLLLFFGGRRLASITTADINTFILKRQKDVMVIGERPRPARGAKAPSASERGWGPAGDEKSDERQERACSNGEWRHVDFEARVVRLDPRTTKNDEGRTFRFTDALERLLEAQKAEHERLKAKGVICPWVFHRSNRKVKGKRITTFIKAFGAACTKAGCPGRIPHDLQRTAVHNLVRRRAHARRHADDRAQDPLGLRALQHRGVSATSSRPQRSSRRFSLSPASRGDCGGRASPERP